MTTNEMSVEFDILYNQVNSNQASSLDEFEKSVFLTKAQDELVRAYFDPRGNKFLEGFDNGELRQYDFSLLIENTELENIDPHGTDIMQYDPRSYLYLMPENLFLTLNESVVLNDDEKIYIYQILPITYQMYQTLMQKPYQYPTKRTVWRLITGQTNKTYDDSKSTSPNNNNQAEHLLGRDASYCEIIGRFVNNDEVPTYKMRYVKKPSPIILVDLNEISSNLSIDGLTEEMECKLPDGIHHRIVQRAVELATAVYNPQALASIVGVGNASATELGIVPRLESK